MLKRRVPTRSTEDLPARPKQYGASDWKEMLGNSPRCGATTVKGTPCEWPSGWGTEHWGIGRCCYHDHAGLRDQRAPLMLYLNPEMRSAVQHILVSEELLNLRTELAVLRYRFAEVNNIDIQSLPLAERKQAMTEIKDLAAVMSKMASSIFNIELALARYVSIEVPGALISAFSDITKNFIGPDQIDQFMHDLEEAIARAQTRSTSRQVAVHALLPNMNYYVQNQETDKSDYENRTRGINMPEEFITGESKEEQGDSGNGHDAGNGPKPGSN